jgi:hypothetical protein|tara:strand:- start:995 stop:1249 length:255 start_codon:yes stop_codon:yes gene_type:complete
MAKPKKKGGPIQKLSPLAARRKARRDVLFAKTKDRKAKKAENQRIGQRSDSDLHHVDGKVGEVKRMSIKNNRGDSGDGTKNDKQ